MKKIIGSVFLSFVLLMVLLSGCAPASTPPPPTTTSTSIPPTDTPVPTATPTELPTITPTPIPTLIFYLRENEELSELPPTGTSQTQVFAGAGHSIEWKTTLQDDIEGTQYQFNIFFGSYSTTSYQLDVILDHNGKQTVLVTTEINIEGTQYELYEKTVSGVDPDTSSGDTLIFRITHIANDSGAVVISSAQQSHIVISSP